MIDASDFLTAAEEHGYRLYSGVPCSYLTPLINAAISSPRTQYIKAANEGDAVAVCCGAELGGMPGVVMFQNSGLGNAVNPLTSLAAVFRIPVLAVCTWRGQPGGPADEPQHELMGRITTQLFDVMEIPWQFIPQEACELLALFRAVHEHRSSVGTPYGLVMRHGSVAPCELYETHVGALPSIPKNLVSDQPQFDADDVLRMLQAHAAPSDAVLATTGHTGRALYALDDLPSQFYMVGSMGCVSSLGLGLSIAQPARRVIVVDGDGAALMRLGALAMVGHYRPRNLLHLLLDNGVHESTGGQSTVSHSVDFPAVASACGYPRVLRIGDMDELTNLLVSPQQELTFALIRTRPRVGAKLPRPKQTCVELAQRFRNWLRYER